MKNQKMFNKAAFVYLFFAAIIIIFTAVISHPENRLIFDLYLAFGALSAVILFVLEGFYYPRLSDASLYAFSVLLSTFLGILLCVALDEWSIIWLLAAVTWVIITLLSVNWVRGNLKKMQEREAQKTAASYLLSLGVSRDGVENCIEAIYHQEQKVIIHQSYLTTSFFPLSLLFFIFYYLNVKEGNGALLLIQYCIYATMLVVGYVWHKFMGKRLQELGEQKSSFVNILNVVK